MAEKVFKYRGKTLEELNSMSTEDFAKLVDARRRRSLLRGLTPNQKKLYAKLSGENKLRTHSRDTIITPILIGRTIEVYNGQKFVPIVITGEMLGHYIGEFSQTRRIAQHKGVGVGATKSSKHQGSKK